MDWIGLDNHTCNRGLLLLSNLIGSTTFFLGVDWIGGLNWIELDNHTFNRGPLLLSNLIGPTTFFFFGVDWIGLDWIDTSIPSLT